MVAELVNDDFSRRVVLATDTLPWLPSPQAGVERRLLDRIGGEVARATSLVRYAPDSVFPAHDHAQGEEYLVLDGVFSDNHGDYPAGTYVRNPPGSRHTPRTAPGCTILVKLRQMTPDERGRLIIDTSSATWQDLPALGLSQLPLYRDRQEHVALERLVPGASVAPYDCDGGEEIFVLVGDLTDASGSYDARTWLRNPHGYRHGLASRGGATYWVKRGHLAAR